MNTLKKTSNPDAAAPAAVLWETLLLKWLLLFADSFFVVLGAIAPESKIPEIIARCNDKILHGTEFFILFWFAVQAPAGKSKKYRLIFALAYCAGMGVLTEYLQSFVPSRTMSALDFLADMAGFCLAGSLFVLLNRKKK